MKQHYLAKRMMLALLFCFSSLLAFAQDRVVSGKITDETGEPLPGVNILVKGIAGVGTSSSVDGTYKLSVPADGKALIFRYIGYKDQEIEIGALAVIDVQMKVDVKALEEVVVVGYGVQQKTDVTGAISQVKSAALQNVPVPSFDAALQGRAAGMQVVQSSGVPGSAVRIRIRGQASITGSSDPLYVVDGVPITTGDFSKRDGSANGVNSNALADLNPNDIESIDILKDAAATAIYGSRGANGVVMITTKRGKAGKTQFTAGYQAGITEATRVLRYTNSTEWLELMDEAHRNSFGVAMPANYNLNRGLTPAGVVAAGTNTNWVDQFLRQGSMHEANISASGGNEKTRFYTGATYRKENSFLVGNSFERFNARLNLDNGDKDDKVKLGAQLGITLTTNNNAPASFQGAQSALPIWPIRNPDGRFFGSNPADNFGFPGTGFNPVSQLENRFVTRGFRSLSNVYAEYKFLPELSFRAEMGLDFLNQFELIRTAAANRFLQPVDYSTNPATLLPIVNAGSFEERRINVYNWNTNNYFTYIKKFGVHDLNLVLGYNLQASAQRTSGIFTNGNAGFADPGFDQSSGNLVIFDRGFLTPYPTMGGYNSDLENRFAYSSFFFRANYKLKDRYIAMLSLRSDRSSRFGPGRQTGVFPALGLGWIMSEEDFMKGISWLSLLKFRASYGITGNSEIPNFLFTGNFGTAGGYLGQPGFGPLNLASPNLGWERNTGLDLGFDFGMFNNRVTGSIAYYNKRSAGLLFFMPVQGSTGYTVQMRNVDDLIIRNSGIEFNVTTRNIVNEADKTGFEWTTDFNIFHNANKVVKAAGLAPDVFAPGLGESRIIEGHPVGIGYMMRSAGVDPNTGRELFQRPDGGSSSLSIENLDWRQPVGRPFPIFQGGINNTLSYKGLELSFLFTFSYGNTIFDNEAKFQMNDIANNNQRRAILNRWQSPENPGDGNTPGVFISGPGAGRGLNSDRWIYDGSFLRLRTLMVAYTLPESIIKPIGLSRAKIFFSGQNLLLFTNFPGWDPEFANTANVGNNGQFFQPFGAFQQISQYQQANMNFNVAQNPFPQQRSFTGGITVNF